MLGWAVALAMPGATLEGPYYEAFHRFGMTEDLWAFGFGVFCFVRMTALYLNGDLKRGPTLRIISSAFGVVTWTQVSILLFQGTWLATGIMQPGPIVYGFLALFDVYSLIRVASDARYERR